MASCRQPTPRCHAALPEPIDDGTTARLRTAAPGSLCREAGGAFVVNARRVMWVRRAFARAERYAWPAIARRTSAEFAQLVRGLIPSLLCAAGGVASITAAGAVIGGGIGLLAAGVGAGPGAIAGAEAGLAVGVWLLEWLGLGFLAAYVVTDLGDASRTIRRGMTTAWHSCGSTATIDAAAHDIADGLARCCAVIAQGLVAYAAKEGLPSAAARIGRTRLGRGIATFFKSPSFARQSAAFWLEHELGRPHEPPFVRVRVARALAFFDEWMPTLSYENKRGFLKAIDFNAADYDLKPITLAAGEELVAYREPSADPLRLFYTKVGASPHHVGIDAEGYTWFRFRVKHDVTVLKCRTSGVKAYNSGAIVGGGEAQYIVPNAKGALELIDRGRREPLGPAIRKIVK